MRPSSKQDPVKLTLYIERVAREHLKILASEDKRSPSQFAENLIEAQWEARELRPDPEEDAQ